MEKQNNFFSKVLRLLSYILVAAIASCATFFFVARSETTKLEELEALILKCFVGDVDQTRLEDSAAAGMLSATGDQWSYYIPAEEYASYLEQMNNAYVGIGIVVSNQSDSQGIEILEVDPAGSAYEEGICAGDVLVTVSGQSVSGMQLSEVSQLIRGEENTQVEIEVLRDGQVLPFTVTRKTIQVVVAEGQMLEENIGLVRINNFDERSAEETLTAIKNLTEQGAQALIFDVRFNPGGYKVELCEILDYLLPEGVIFRSQTYDGKESVTQSDAACLDLPFAVLINGQSYSAAEFFAAALNEYDKAVVIGEPTVGKSYFQNTYCLRDGSAVALSVGKYCTPNGVSLAEVGGLKPETEIILDKETAAKLQAGALPPEEDPHVLAAIAALKAET